MKARYFKSADDVLFLNSIPRFLARIFGNEALVIKCKVCKKIPTEVYGNVCLEHIKPKQRR
jgi:hypothetical protein